MSEDYLHEPIGEIQTPFETLEGMPIQPASDESTQGTVVVDPAYEAGLADLDGFSHCILIYQFHAGDDDYSLRPTPFLDGTERGLFATRAPNRPNGIGLSIVGVESVEGRELTVSGIDVVDGTPLFDIKPFVPQFDVPAEMAAGWVDETDAGVESMTADDRFR
ncbi:MAG: tRNA (N6-threonylcarbamoyladenosine(37)-N6)-methyltransferase TrmO [Salinarchaeum sp.]